MWICGLLCTLCIILILNCYSVSCQHNSRYGHHSGTLRHGYHGYRSYYGTSSSTAHRGPGAIAGIYCAYCRHMQWHECIKRFCHGYRHYYPPYRYRYQHAQGSYYSGR